MNASSRHAAIRGTAQHMVGVGDVRKRDAHGRRRVVRGTALHTEVDESTLPKEVQCSVSPMVVAGGVKKKSACGQLLATQGTVYHMVGEGGAVKKTA